MPLASARRDDKDLTAAGPGTTIPTTATPASSGRGGAGTTSLAHELAHVVAAPASNAGTGARQTAPTTGTAAQQGGAGTAQDVAPGTVELKGRRELEPGPAVAAFLAQRREGLVMVQFGTLARGPILVRRTSTGYAFRDQAIPLEHPLFARARAVAPGLVPSLVLSLRDGAVAGHVAIAGQPGAVAAPLAHHLRTAPELFGLAGFSFPSVPPVLDELQAGVLRLGVEAVPVRLGSAFNGSVTLTATDESVTFGGSADVAVAGVASGSMQLARGPDGVVTGRVSLAVQLSPHVTGSVDVVWDGEALTGQGKVGYQGDKLSGQVTLRVLDRAVAETLARQATAAASASPVEAARAGERAGAPARTAAPGRARGPIHYALLGEGDLSYSFTSWLSGTARVVLDHRGDVTVVGRITPQAEVELLPPQYYVKDLFKLEARALYGIPVVGNVFISASLSLAAFAILGPARLYKIVVDGAYSTNPQKSRDFTVTGSLNLSAAAGLRLRAEASVGIEILEHDIKAGAAVNGMAAIKAYAEATPVIGYRERARPGEDRQGEFFISGEIAVAAQPFLGLGGDVFVEIDAPWWSPVPDKKWIWPLFGKEWPVGGALGFAAAVDYVFGSHEYPTIEIKPPTFEADKFLSDLYTDRVKPTAATAPQAPAAWSEKATRSSEPPTPRASGRQRPAAGPPTVPAAASHRPVPARVGGRRPADPAAATADGRSVGDLKAAAAKRGGKPAGAEPATGGTSARSAKSGTAGEDHDKRLAEGLAALHAVTDRYARDGADRDEVVTGVKAVRRKFSVFRSIEVVDGGATWDYEYVASPGTKLPGPKKKAVSIRIENGALVIGAQTFSVGERITLARGGGWLREARVITGFRVAEISGLPITMVTFDTDPPSGSASVSASTYPRQWRKRVLADEGGLDDGALKVENSKGRDERWANKDIARWVLNYRAVGRQSPNPEGKDWEHIAEQDTGGSHRASNMALADSALNRRLGTYYRTYRRYPSLALEGILQPIRLVDYMRGKDERFQEEWKRAHVYPSDDFRVTVRWASPSPRGPYQVLE